MKKQILTLGLMLGVTSFAFSQQQVNNNGFESWENPGGNEEPVSWSNMETGDLCFFCGFGSSQRAFPDNTELAPGTAGTTSVRIETTVAAGTAVNGTITTGRMHAPSTTPSDGYTQTHTGSAGNSPDDWEELISQSPDSIVFWAKYNPQGGAEARISANLHTNYDQKNPYSNDGAGNNNVNADATLNFTTGGVWKRMSIPFDYNIGGQTSHSRILVTLTATAQVGAPSSVDGSTLWVDDLYLVYNVSATYPTAAICAGEPISVDFTTNGTTTAARTFTAELSDASGSFASPTVIGTLNVNSGVSSGTIAATLPAGAATGSGYRIRVTGNHGGYSPVNTGTQFTINATPAAPTAGTDASYCTGDTPADLTATAGSGGSLTWYSNAGLTTQIGTGTTHTPGTTGGTTTYYVTETLSGCESTASTVDITYNSPAVAGTASASASTSCTSPDGQVTVSGGSGASSYELYDAGNNLITSNGSGTFTGLTPGDYYVTYVNTLCANDNTSTVTVGAPTAPTAGTLSGTDVTNCTTPDGTVSLAGSNGASFELFNAGGATTGQTNATGNFSGLNAGTYEVVATAANGCTSTSNSVVVDNASAPVAPSAGANATYCEGDTPTDLTATAGSGGTLTWYLGGNVEGTGGTLTPNTSTAGTLGYTVTETVAGCESAPTTVTITVNPSPVAGTATPTASTSCTTPDGQVVVSGDNGDSYELFDAANNSIGTNTTGIFTGLDPDDYYVVVTNVCGTDNTANVTVGAPAAPTAGTTATVDNSNCQTPDGEVNVTGSNGTDYELFDAGDNSQGTNTTGAFAGLSDGDYYVVITGTNGCTTTTNTVTVNAPNYTVTVAPSTTQDIDISTNGTTISSTESATASSRAWMYTTTSGSGYTSFTPAETGASYTPNFASAGTYYVVCESVISGCDVMSSEVQINVTDPGVGVDENEMDLVNVYSYENQMFVDLSEVSLKNPVLKLFSTDGKVVLKERLNNGSMNNFNVDLPVGVYIYNIVTNNKVTTGKVILK